MDMFITWIKAAWDIHSLQVVMTAFLMFFQRAALLIAATTISTLMGFANWRKHNSLRDSDEVRNSVLITIRTTGKKPTPKINPRYGEPNKDFDNLKTNKQNPTNQNQTNGKLFVCLYINRPVLWVLQADFRWFTSDKDCDIKSSKTASTQVRNWDTFKGLGVVAFVPSSHRDSQQGNWWCR